jgi:hypothetical protein
MALQSYSDLQAAITSWLDRSDLAARATDFIALAEADFRRQIVMPDMETTVTISGTSPISLPIDLDSIRALVAPQTATDLQQTLQPIDLASYYDLLIDAQGQPCKYATDGSNLYVWPIPTTSINLTLAYRAQLPALSNTVTTNWLFSAHPDAYLFGSLLQAEFYGWNDDRLPLIQTKLSSIIEDINVTGNRKRYGGQLAMRPATHEGLWRVRGGVLR